jgi:protein involved in polysaccharide export with SLBB domain
VNKGALVSLVVAIGVIAGCASRPDNAIRSSLHFEEKKVFAVGDCFQLEVRGVDLGGFIVGEDGSIALPLLAHRVQVAGLTAQQAAEAIAESYRPDGPRASEVKLLPCFKSRY